MSTDLEPDYIIVGAGSAGCILAARLAESLPNKFIMLLEQGPEDSYEQPRVSSTDWLWNALGGKSPINFGYFTAPQKEVNDRKLPVPRGKGLGGSSLLNAMNYTRPYAEDFDQNWPKGWKAREVESSFKSIEERLALQKVPASNLGDKMIESAKLNGFEIAGKEETLSWTRPGAYGFSYLMLDQGKRQTTFSAFLKPIVDKEPPNLSVLCNIRVEKIIFDDSESVVKAKGLICSRVSDSMDEVEETFDINLSSDSTSEIILCLGSIHTPQLLMVSGIGDRSELMKQGIETLVNIKAVGKNLHDHFLVPLIFRTKQSIEPSLFCKGHIQGYINIAGGTQILLSDGSLGPAAFAKQIPESIFGQARKKYIIVEALATAMEKFLESVMTIQAAKNQAERIISFLVALMTPKSRGTVTIASKYMKDQPVIDPCFLTENEDIEKLLVTFRVAREIAFSEPLDEIRSFALAPALWGNSPLPETATTEEVLKDKEILLSHFRDVGSSYYHACSTCKMSEHPMEDGVVDGELKVYGTANLRIADASVIPVIPRVPIASTVMMIGARCAQFIIDSQE